MAKDLYTLRQERGEAELAALQQIAASRAPHIDLLEEIGEGARGVLNPAQESRLLAEKQLEVLREARDEGKDAYVEAHLTYQVLVKKRRAELVETLFGATASMDVGDLDRLMEASEETMEEKVNAVILSNNEAYGQALLLSAYTRDLDVIHTLVGILDDEDETLGALFSELFEIDQEQITDDTNVLGEELRLRYDTLVENTVLEDLMPGSPKRATFLRGR